MSTQTLRRFFRLATLTTAAAALSACSQTGTTEPHRTVRSTVANHDGVDPTTCRSGYQVINGIVVCN